MNGAGGVWMLGSTISGRLGPDSFKLSGRAGGADVSGRYGDPMRRSVLRFLQAARRGERDAVFSTPERRCGR